MAEGKDPSTPIPLATGVTIIVLYSVLGGLLVLLWFALLWLGELKKFFSPKIVGFFFITALVALRIPWGCLLMWPKDSYTDFIINRLALCLLFSAVSLVIFLLTDRVKSPASDTTTTGGSFLANRKLFWGFILVNVIVYLGQLGFIIAYCVQESAKRPSINVAYDVNLILLTILTLIAALCLLGYGLWLFWLSRSTPKGNKWGPKLLLTATAIACTLVLRVILFLWRPSTGDFVDPTFFYVCCYLVPDATAAVFLTYILVGSSLAKRINKGEA